MILYIKYMVSLRCKMMVKEELKKLGISFNVVELGTVEMPADIAETKRLQLKSNLLKCGLELLDDKKSILIEKIKNVIVEMVHYSDELTKMNFSEYISDKLKLDYTYLSNTFSEVKGITIQQFIILHKVEKIKELLLYDELNLTQISYKLNYSSVSHLSNQFKKVTGLSPSFYKQLKQKRQQNLENL
ncbi:MAG: AraC family transcriptional regulator [Ferruginibacter sp.]